MKYVLLLLLYIMAFPLTAAEWPVAVDWLTKVTLSTPLTGKVATVEVEAGQQVKKGQLLVALDARLYEAEVKSAQNILKRAKVTFEESQRAFDRATELYDRTVLSTTDYQEAELDYAIATADYHNSQALLTKAKINREYTQIRAPFDGIILERMVNPGETISSEYQVQPLLMIAATGQMLASGWVPENALQNIATGQSIELNIRDDKYRSTVKSVATQYRETQKDTEFLMEFVFTPPAKKGLLPGMRGMAVIP